MFETPRNVDDSILVRAEFDNVDAPPFPIDVGVFRSPSSFLSSFPPNHKKAESFEEDGDDTPDNDDRRSELEEFSTM